MTLSPSTAGLLTSLSDELAAAVARAGRSIVAVHGRRRLPASGIVWQPTVVVTAAHVLERGVDITVAVGDQAPVPARLVGYDAGSDLAVLAVQGAPVNPSTSTTHDSTGGSPGLVPAERADLNGVSPGVLVLAVGRPGTPEPMASFGVVTSTGGAWRTAQGGVLDAYLRADVALLPGFSGGAVVDVQGRVVGILSSQLASGDPMAIPCGTVDRLVQAISSGGIRRRGYLGISTQAVDLQQGVRQSLGIDQEAGLILLGLEQDGPADRAGLLLGDILLSLGGRPVVDGEALQMALGPEVVGQSIPARLVRGGRLLELGVTPGERP